MGFLGALGTRVPSDSHGKILGENLSFISQDEFERKTWDSKVPLKNVLSTCPMKKNGEKIKVSVRFYTLAIVLNLSGSQLGPA